MSSRSGSEEADRAWDGGVVEGAGSREDADGRLERLMEEFRRRQRECPDLAVRPWWTVVEDRSGGRSVGPYRKAAGFVVEYCPRGVDSAELTVRRDRVRVEGPGGLREAPLDLSEGWRLAGEEVSCPELMVNHLLLIADRLLGEAA